MIIKSVWEPIGSRLLRIEAAAQVHTICEVIDDAQG